MAAEYGYLPAMEKLGYMWYYGKHGEKDYDKAFYYFSREPEKMARMAASGVIISWLICTDSGTRWRRMKISIGR
jgi:TPR repeat protein